MKNKIKELLDKIPFNGYKSILGTAIAVFVVPQLPATVSVFGGAIAVKAIVSGFAATLAAAGLTHKLTK